MVRLKNVPVVWFLTVSLTGCSGVLDAFEGQDGGPMSMPSEPHRDAGAPTTPDASGSDDDAPFDAGSEHDAGLSEHDSGAEPMDLCVEGPDASLDVVSVTVTGPEGAAPEKGDELTVHITVRNDGAHATSAVLTVLLDSFRFEDFRAIPLARGELRACPGESVLTVRGGPFLSDPATNAQFALGSGDYAISAIQIERGDEVSTDGEFTGADFHMATNNVLLVPVLYNSGYFEEIEGEFASPEAYLREAFTRKSEVFTPSNPADPDGAGTYEVFEGGFDEMMNVRHVFKSFPGFDGTYDSGENWCYGAMDYASQVLGLKARWTGGPTRDDQHGFDYVIALSSKMGGGVAWHPYNVQVSGFINRDVPRQQIIAVHESGHLFGAPHCDDVGNGEGGKLQGYVMCAGEKHAHYPQSFVWHITSRQRMSSRWN